MTFVLCAGFSTEAGFPLIRDDLHPMIYFMLAEDRPKYAAHFRPHPGDPWPEGQFVAGLKKVDPLGEMGLEELSR